MSTTYVITGATGHIGGVIANHLLDKKQDVRVIGRSADRLAALVARGAKEFVGDLEDAAFVDRAFAGAQAAFVMIPPKMVESGFRAYQDRLTGNYAAAIKKNHVKHVVVLSSIGADLTAGAGPVNGLHGLEERFNTLDASVLFMRPGFFMENMLMNIPMIKQMGILGSALNADARLSMIATADIGEYGARRLLSLDFTGKSVQELRGPEDLSMPVVAHALGEAIGKPGLKYVPFTYEDSRKGMIGMGLPAELTDLYLEMYRAFNEGKVKPTQERSSKTNTPTSIQAFAKGFAEAYRAN